MGLVQCQSLSLLRCLRSLSHTRGYSQEGLEGLEIHQAHHAPGCRRRPSNQAYLGHLVVLSHLGKNLQYRMTLLIPCCHRRINGLRVAELQRLTFGGSCSGVSLQSFGSRRPSVTGSSLWKQAHGFFLFRAVKDICGDDDFQFIWLEGHDLLSSSALSKRIFCHAGGALYLAVRCSGL